MPLQHENRRRQIILNVTPYIVEVDSIALSLINQFKSYGADPEVTRLDDYKLSLTFRETQELTYEVACQKILWNQYVQNIEQKNITNNIELLRKMVDPYFGSPVVASSEVLGDGKGQLNGISPSAFSDGEVLWSNGQPIKQPSYSIGDEAVRVPAGGPLPLSRDLDKDAQSSTITAFKKRYAAMDKDTFFAGDGVIKVGDEFHTLKKDYRQDVVLGDGTTFKYRGGGIELPNKHIVSGNGSYSENYDSSMENFEFNETPRTAEVAIISPEHKFIQLDKDPEGKYSYVYARQTTEQVKGLIRRAKEL